MPPHPVRAHLIPLAIVGSCFIAACARRDGTVRSDTRVPSTVSGPRLLRLRPDSAAIGAGQIVTVFAVGSGFDATDNTIDFGPVELRGIASSATRDTLTFSVPLTMAARGGAPPRALESGTYHIRIRTSAGTTDSLPFRVNADYPR